VVLHEVLCLVSGTRGKAARRRSPPRTRESSSRCKLAGLSSSCRASSRMYQRRRGSKKVAARIACRVFGDRASMLAAVRIMRNYVRISRICQYARLVPTQHPRGSLHLSSNAAEILREALARTNTDVDAHAPEVDNTVWCDSQWTCASQTRQRRSMVANWRSASSGKATPSLAWPKSARRWPKGAKARQGVRPRVRVAPVTHRNHREYRLPQPSRLATGVPRFRLEARARPRRFRGKRGAP